MVGFLVFLSREKIKHKEQFCPKENDWLSQSQRKLQNKPEWIYKVVQDSWKWIFILLGQRWLRFDEFIKFSKRTLVLNIIKYSCHYFFLKKSQIIDLILIKAYKWFFFTFGIICIKCNNLLTQFNFLCFMLTLSYYLRKQRPLVLLNELHFFTIMLPPIFTFNIFCCHFH